MDGKIVQGNEVESVFGLTQGDMERALQNLWRHSPHWPDGSRIRHHSQIKVNESVFYAHSIGGYPEDGPVATVRADASYKRHPLMGKIATQAWHVEIPGKRRTKDKVRIRRQFKGASQMAETGALVEGLKEAEQRGAKHVVLVTDAQTPVHFLAGTWEPDPYGYTEQTRDALLEQAKRFASVQVRWVKTKPELKDVDRLAKAKLKESMREMDEKWEGIVRHIESQMAGATSATYQGEEATADPPACSCPDWKYRVDRPLRLNPRNLSKVCKHVAAAFVSSGLDPGVGAERVIDYYLGEYPSNQ